MATPLAIEYLLSKTGRITPATRSKAIEIIKVAQANGHYIRFVWGYDPNAGNVEHNTGRALDIMVNSESAGDFVRNYVWNNRARLNLKHVIWEQHITSTVVQPGVRRKMPDRGNPTANHDDHNHILFFDGDYVAPKTTPSAPKPRPKPEAPKKVTVRVLKTGVQGRDVKRLQSELKRVFPSYAGALQADGVFGAKTDAAVKEFQRRAKISPDGDVGPKTRAALRKHGVRL